MMLSLAVPCRLPQLQEALPGVFSLLGDGGSSSSSDSDGPAGAQLTHAPAPSPAPPPLSLHISLSRTLQITYEQIQPLTSSLEKVLRNTLR